MGIDIAWNQPEARKLRDMSRTNGLSLSNRKSNRTWDYDTQRNQKRSHSMTHLILGTQLALHRSWLSPSQPFQPHQKVYSATSTLTASPQNSTPSPDRTQPHLQNSPPSAFRVPP